jgi:lipoprotein-anchoring transpeptidase ErfK/SrfK
MTATEGNSKAIRQGMALLALAFFATAKVSAQNVAAPVAVARPRRYVLVSITDRKLAVLESGQVVKVFSVAVGAAVSPSPTGEFEIANRITRPAYYHSGEVVPPGKGNPVGTRWIGLNKKGYGIHGTNAPRSIGKAASHGCIRLRNHDVEQLFELVSVGDTVEIRGERDQQVAQIFGGEDQANETVAQVQTTTVAQAQTTPVLVPEVGQ